MIKKFFALPIIIILTLIVIKPYFHAGFPYTHDGENHLARFANYKIAVKEGQIPPRFAPSLMNHYGYPVFNYNYPLANILSLPFSFLKINYEITFKILATTFVFIGLLGVYSWLDKLKTPYSAMLFGTAIYATSPFIWSTVLFRGNIGEIMAWGLFPWLLWLIKKHKSESLNLIDILILTTFLLSHNVTVMFGLPLMLVYGLFEIGKNKQAWTKILFNFLASISLTLWFWLPAVAEKNLVSIGEANLVTGFTNHFPTLRQLLFSPLTFGLSFLGSIDSLSISIGVIQLFIILITLIVILKSFFKYKKIKIEKNIAIFSVVSLLLIIFQLKITQPVWQIIPLLAFIQFPWRLSLFLGIFLAGLGAIIWTKLTTKIKFFFFIILFLQLFSFSRAKPVDYFHRNIEDYDYFSQSTTTSNENTPKTFTMQDVSSWQPTAQIIQGSGDVKINFWNGSKRKYSLVLHEPSIIVEPTMNFAGWETTVLFEGQRSTINYINDEQIKGRVAYQLEKPGEYEITTRFTQKTWPRLVGNGVSILALILSLVLFFKRFLDKELNFYLNWKILLFFVSLAAPLFLYYDPSFPYASTLLAKSGLPSFIYSWANFDGVHYLTIINKGYFGTGLIQAFFPLYPMLVKFLAKIIGSPILAGLIFNFIIGFLLLKVWKKIVDLEIDVNTKSWAVYLLFLFPTALFFNSFYSEALFLFLVLWSFLSARRGRWLKAGLIAALASATRLVGIFLVPALLVELWLQKTAQCKADGDGNCYHPRYFCQKYWRQIIAISTGALGLIAYMIYLQKQFNDPLYFYHLQSEFGSGRQESIVLYPQVVWRYLKILWTARPFDLKYYAYVQEFIFGVLGLAGIIWSWFRVRKSYVVFSALVFLLPTLTGTFSSMPRYFLASFSVFLLMIKIFEQSKPARLFWLSLSTLWLIFNTILFIQGYWVA